MSVILRLGMTLAASAAVGLLFRRIGIPGGMMLGGIVGAACLNLVSENAYAPFFARFFAQSAAGGFLGASIDRDKLKQLPRLAVPLAVIVAGLLLTDFVIGGLILLLSPLDSITAFCSGIAGGINDVPLIAADMGADAGKVAVMQFVRLITGIVFVPTLIRFLDKSATQKSEGVKGISPKKSGVSLQKTVVGLLAAMVGGSFGKWTSIPGGMLLFSMIAIALLHLTTGYGAMNPVVKQAAQLLSGMYIGCLLHRQDILELQYLILPAMILIAVFLVNDLVCGFFLRKVSAMSVKESMLACSPAGAGEMALMSSELNIAADFAADIMLLHVFRVIIVISFFPRIAFLAAKLF